MTYTSTKDTKDPKINIAHTPKDKITTSTVCSAKADSMGGFITKFMDDNPKFVTSGSIDKPNIKLTDGSSYSDNPSNLDNSPPACKINEGGLVAKPPLKKIFTGVHNEIKLKSKPPVRNKSMISSVRSKPLISIDSKNKKSPEGDYNSIWEDAPKKFPKIRLSVPEDSVGQEEVVLPENGDSFHFDIPFPEDIISSKNDNVISSEETFEPYLPFDSNVPLNPAASMAAPVINTTKYASMVASAINTTKYENPYLQKLSDVEQKKEVKQQKEEGAEPEVIDQEGAEPEVIDQEGAEPEVIDQKINNKSKLYRKLEELNMYYPGKQYEKQKN